VTFVPTNPVSVTPVPVTPDEEAPASALRRRSFVGFVGATLAVAESHDLDTIRNGCRCGTYSRIREAVKTGAARM
jgi:isoquinoline 1-oxidoreductase alpha subunit